MTTNVLTCASAMQHSSNSSLKYTKSTRCTGDARLLPTTVLRSGKSECGHSPQAAAASRNPQAVSRKPQPQIASRKPKAAAESRSRSRIANQHWDVRPMGRSKANKKHILLTTAGLQHFDAFALRANCVFWKINYCGLLSKSQTSTRSSTLVNFLRSSSTFLSYSSRRRGWLYVLILFRTFR